MLERLTVDLGIKEGSDLIYEEQLNDMVNDVYGFVYAFSLFISPLIGSLMYL